MSEKTRVKLRHRDRKDGHAAELHRERKRAFNKARGKQSFVPNMLNGVFGYWVRGAVEMSEA